MQLAQHKTRNNLSEDEHYMNTNTKKIRSTLHTKTATSTQNPQL